MPTRNIVLTSRQAEFIERLVSTGRYQNASEVLRAGIRLIERMEAEDEARLTALREAARIGTGLRHRDWTTRRLKHGPMPIKLSWRLPSRHWRTGRKRPVQESATTSPLVS